MTLSTVITDTAEAAAQIFTAGGSGGEEAIPELVHGFELLPIVVGLDALSIVVAAVIGYVGVAIMTYGTLESLWHFLRSVGGKNERLPMIRVNLGKHLSLGLEFLVGKDIVESIVHPTWDDLGKLGAIIALRTIVTVFLSRELKEVEDELTLEEHEIALARKRRKAEEA